MREASTAVIAPKVTATRCFSAPMPSGAQVETSVWQLQTHEASDDLPRSDFHSWTRLYKLRTCDPIVNARVPAKIYGGAPPKKSAPKFCLGLTDLPQRRTLDRDCLELGE
eukprot:gb/GEZN01016075.1/.p1 GENE.gb/GEZN01016075.1/~~gb/GEZN01016075.1/.p1  ORF type:complete len:123 (+),score=9.37 gb/GEZN01016075.1/:40-369(+)